MIRKLKKLSVTTQVILVVVCLVLPINIVSLVYAAQMRSSFLQQVGNAEIHVAELFLKELDKRMETADDAMYRDTNDNVRAARMIYWKEGEEYAANACIYWQELYDLAKSGQGGDAYFFYMKGPDYGNAAVGSGIATEERHALMEYVRACARDDLRYSWKMVEIGEKTWLIHLSSVKGSYYYGSAIDLDEVLEEVKASLPSEGRTLWMDEEPGTEQADTFLAVSQNSDLAVHLELSRKEVFREMPLVIQMGMILCIFFLISIPVILWVMRKVLIQPVKGLIYAMEQLKNGEQDYRIPPNSGKNRETESLNQEFNSMAERLKELKIQVYEEKLQRMDIEATNLRLQVNPHFILNCLNIIFSLARSHNEENLKNIKVFTKYLADYLRFSLWHTSGTVRLGEELKCVKNYMEIQKIRFQDKFTFLVDVEEELLDTEIPSLLILNFVENSIKYALNMEREIEIIVSVRQEQEELRISVCDTGNGMPEETLENLRRGEAFEDVRGKHIGIWNCRRRLHMMYGDAAYFSVTSKPEEGTQIFIRIPAEVKTDEFADCGR